MRDRSNMVYQWVLISLRNSSVNPNDSLPLRIRIYCMKVHLTLKVNSLNSLFSSHTLTLIHIHSYTHTFIHSYTHTLIHSYTHTLIHSYTHTLIHSHTHALIYSHTHTLIHSYTHTFIHTHIQIHLLNTHS